MRGRDPSLTLTTLADWLEGRLDEAEEQRVADAVAVADPETAATVAWLEDFLSAARAMPLQTPPPELSSRLRALFADQVAPYRDDAWTSATLLHDTRLPQAAAGMRSGTAERTNLAFDSELGRFILEATPTGAGTVDVHGLLALDGAAPQDLTVSFMRDGEVCRAVTPTPDGRFTATGVPDDVDELWLVDGQTRVRATIDVRTT